MNKGAIIYLILLLTIIFDQPHQISFATNGFDIVILSVPHYYQVKWYFCGPASVQMVLHYISGVKINQYVLANEMHTSSSSGGTYTNYMPKPFRLRGYSAIEIKPMNVDKLKYYLSRNRPVIILIWFDTRKKSQHYVVVIGYDNDGIYIHDPWPEKWGKAKDRNLGSFVHISYSMLLKLWNCSYPFWGLVVDKMLPTISFSFDSPIDTDIKINVETSLTKFQCKVRRKSMLLIGSRPGTHRIIIDKYIDIGDKSRLRFIKWSDGDKKNVKTINLKDDYSSIVLKATYFLQYYLTVLSDYGDVYGNGWYDNGSTVEVGVSKPIISLSKDCRLILKGWSVNNSFIEKSGSIILQISSPVTVKAIWKKQYYVRIDSVYEVYGEGWYEEGENIKIGVLNSPIYISNDTRVKFDAWIIDNQVVSRSLEYQFNVNRPINIIAKWSKEYYINIISKINIPVEGCGWYKHGAKATIKILSTKKDLIFYYYEFAGWMDENGTIVSTNPSYTFSVTSPATYRVVWILKYNIVTMSLILAIIIIIITIILCHRRREKIPPPPPPL